MKRERGTVEFLQWVWTAARRKFEIELHNNPE